MKNLGRMSTSIDLLRSYDMVFLFPFRGLRDTCSDRIKGAELMLEKINTILFDMDGTLYQDNIFYKDYMKYAAEGTKFENQLDRLNGFIESIINGDTLQMNKFYRQDQPPVREIDSLNSALMSRCVEDDTVGEQMALDGEKSCYMGDMWAVVRYVAQSLGMLDGDKGLEVFVKTRKAMAERGFDSAKPLIKAINELHGKYRVLLVTNSYKTTAMEFLKVLGYERNMFDKIVFEACKPVRLLESLEKFVPGILNEPEKLLSIGDHVYNDLLPIKRIGGSILWINPYKNIPAPAICKLSVRTTDELADFLHSNFVNN